MRHILCLLLLAFAAPFAQAQVGITANAPVTNFRLPILDEAGVRTSLLRGREARYINDTRIDLVEMQCLMFRPKAPTEVETTILAPTATVLRVNRTTTIQGDQTVRLVRDDVVASGEQWTYEHDSKRLSINKNVRVVFSSAKLTNLIR